MKKKIEQKFSFLIKPVSVAINSVWNFGTKFWNVAEKIRDEKCLFSARIYVEKFRNLIKICSNYEDVKQ